MSEVTTDGLGFLMRENSARAESLQNVAGFIDEVGEKLKSNRLTRFDEEAGPDGEPWAPLAESTQLAFVRRTRVTRMRGAGARTERPTLLAAFRRGRARRGEGAATLARQTGMAGRAAGTGMAERRGADHILVNTGMMRGSMNLETDAGEGYGSASVGFPEGGPALYHQVGTSRMPDRPILGFDERDRKDIADLFQYFLNKQVWGRGAAT